MERFVIKCLNIVIIVISIYLGYLPAYPSIAKSQA